MPHNMCMKYVYVMRPKPYLKIGISNSPTAKCWQPTPTMVGSCLETAEAKAIVDKVHEAIKGMSHGKGWFDLTLKDAMKAIELAAKEVAPQYKTPASFQELLYQLKGDQSREEFSDELETTYWRVVGWFKHGNIPSWHWDKILEIAAARNRRDITLKLLIELNKNRAKKPIKPG